MWQSAVKRKITNGKIQAKVFPHSFNPESAKQQRSSIQNILRSTGAQAKLTIGQPNDKYEQEADRIADQVMRMSDADVAQRVETGTVQPMRIQRLEAGKEEDELQAKEMPGQKPTVAPNLESRINSLKGGGQPLDPSTRAFFEPRFGHNFSNVRVHTGNIAAETTKSINAHAFTQGNNVVFNSGQYQPQSIKGRRLLGHELTHVIQQKRFLRNSIHLQDASGGQHTQGNSLRIRVDPTCIPLSSEQAAMEGGWATVDGLQTKLETTVLHDWESGVKSGIHIFSTGALLNRINDLSQGNLSNFLLGFAGNTVWAAAAFVPVGAPAFALSMAGIAISSLPAAASLSQPIRSSEPIVTVERKLDTVVSQIYRELNRGVPNKIRLLLAACPFLSLHRAMFLFIRDSFGSDSVDFVDSFLVKPMLKQEVLRDRFEATANSLLNRFLTEVIPIGQLTNPITTALLNSDPQIGNPTIIAVNKAAWIRFSNGTQRLALVVKHSMDSIFIHDISYSFGRWIDPDLVTAALAIAGEDLLNLESVQVDRLPVPVISNR